MSRAIAPKPVTGITCLCGGRDGGQEPGCRTLDAKQAGKAMTARCAFCPWTLSGPTRECIAAGVRHRKNVHGIEDPKKKLGDGAKVMKARKQRERTEKAAELLPDVRRALQAAEGEVTEGRLMKHVPGLTAAMITMMADHGAILAPRSANSRGARRISLPASDASVEDVSPVVVTPTVA